VFMGEHELALAMRVMLGRMGGDRSLLERTATANA